MAVKFVEEFCGDFCQGRFALNTISRKLRRKLRRHPEAWLRKNLSKKNLSSGKKTSPRAPLPNADGTNACAKLAAADESP